MRKERLIVPAVVALALLWALAQAITSLRFEHELARAIEDLQARGELRISRTDIERGWLGSSGRLHLSPLLGDAWHLDVTYQARHGLLSTRLHGELSPHLAPAASSSPGFGTMAPPYWEARYHTLSGTFDGHLGLSPFLFRQGERRLVVSGTRIDLEGGVGDWRLRGRVASMRLSDGRATLAAGPIRLESRYAYTDGAYHFTQQDQLRVQGLAWRSPSLALDAEELRLNSRTVLDEQELRIRSELTLGEVLSGEGVLLTGTATLELSRINADALRSVLAGLKREAARGEATLTGRELLARLEPNLLALLEDSPRLDALAVDLASPMLGLTLQGDGALIFDARRLDQLSLVALGEATQQARWRERLDGDFLWRDLPTMVALWLGLPLDTRELQIDVVRGEVRLNGRPLPPILERLQ